MIGTMYDLGMDAWDGAKSKYNKTTYFTKISIVMLFLAFLIGSFFAFWIVLFRGTLNFFDIPLKPLAEPKLFKHLY